MIDLRRAFRVLIGAAEPLAVERVPAAEAAGRVAAADITAPADVPGFLRVMMDGYACRAADIATASAESPAALRVSGEAAAGRPVAGGPAPGEAWRVTTGAELPAGADVVVPLEQTRRQGDRVLVRQALPAGRNVAGAGEDVRRGECIVRKGERIGPATAGVLVAAGLASVPVIRRPRVLLLCTGSEVTDPDTGAAGAPPAPEPPAGRRVHNSNAAILAADLRDLGIAFTYAGVLPDEPERLRVAFRSALASEADVILTTGGVSVGPYDRVPRTWLDLGARRLLGRIDVKPGGPFFAARHRDKWIIGLPGSPAACLATYQVLVRPFLLRLAGHRCIARPVVPAVLSRPFPKPADRDRLLWARLEGAVPPYRAHLPTGDEGRLTWVARCNGLLWIPKGTPALKAGSRLPGLRLDLPEDREEPDWEGTGPL